jgi:rRNA maturation protein Nop10
LAARHTSVATYTVSANPLIPALADSDIRIATHAARYTKTDECPHTGTQTDECPHTGKQIVQSKKTKNEFMSYEEAAMPSVMCLAKEDMPVSLRAACLCG